MMNLAISNEMTQLRIANTDPKPLSRVKCKVVWDCCMLSFEQGYFGLKAQGTL